MGCLDAPSPTLVLDAFRAAFDALLLALVVATNVVIVAVVARRWATRGMPLANVTSALLVVNLSAADALVGACTVYYFLPRYWCGLRVWLELHPGDCLLRFVPVILAHLASGYTLVAIAADRYVAVVHAVRYRDILSRRRTVLMLVVIWLLAAAGSCVLFGWNNVHGASADVDPVNITWSGLQLRGWRRNLTGDVGSPDRSDLPGEADNPSNASPTHSHHRKCTEHVLPLAYTVVVGVLGQVVIMGTVTFAHWRIHRVALRLRARSGGDHASTRAARVLLLILGVYTASWAPFMVTLVIQLTGGHVPIVLLEVTSSLVNFNYLVNPFLYAYNNRPIRRTIQQFVMSVRRRAVVSMHDVTPSATEDKLRPVNLAISTGATTALRLCDS